MKKNLLSLSIAALIGGLGVAGVANAGVAQLGTGAAAPAATAAGLANLTNATALGISPAGIGHILMVPYFTAQNGNATLLSVVNTDTVNGKAVKVRFRGAANSDDLLDFPWHHPLILHEAGMPPIHTPLAVLAELPEDVKGRLYLTHISEGAIPAESGLRLAPPGASQTLAL